MPSLADGAAAHRVRVPSMLDLVRLSPRRLFPPGGAELYRQIALLAELSAHHEVLGVACGKGVSLEYFVREYGLMASGVEIDDRLVDEAEAWSREEGIADRLQFQTGRSDALPYRDDVFDVTLGEIGLANHCEPEAAVRELVRVTKPGGFIVLVQLVWKAPVDESRRAILSEHLGAKPLMLVEWKRLLREAGVEDLHTEDWSDEETAFRPTVVKPFPDFAELFSLWERLGILRRAWSLWGWRGVSSVLARESEVHRLLTNERILGLDLLRGRIPAGDASVQVDEDAADASEPATVTAAESSTDGSSAADSSSTAPEADAVPTSVAALPHPADAPDDEEPESRHADPEEVRGLPLFADEESTTNRGDEDD